jgi:hypothetical protein
VRTPITITGSIPLEDRGYSGGIGISHPALLFVYLLRTSLAQKGVVITGKSRTTGAEKSTHVDHGSPDLGSRTVSAPFQMRSRHCNHRPSVHRCANVEAESESLH